MREFRMVVPEHEAMLWACPNGELRTEATAELLRCMGVVPGVPDLRLITWRGRQADIEIKLDKTAWHAKTYCSADQRELGDLMRAMGHEVFVIRNADEFWMVAEHLGVQARGPRRVQYRLTGLAPELQSAPRTIEMLTR